MDNPLLTLRIGIILNGPDVTIFILILLRKAIIPSLFTYNFITNFRKLMVISLTSLEEHDCDINQIFL